VTLVITPARPEEFPAAARLLADTMAGFGVAVLGAGNEALELRALAQWFSEKGNRFSYQFAHIARWEGELAGLLLSFPGRDVERLSLACRHSIFRLYDVRILAKLIWRGMVIGHNREAEKDEFLVAHVAVLEQFRRKGIATALLEKAALLAKEEGFSRVALEVEIGNVAAIECYQRFGFITQFTTNFGRHAGLLQCPGYHKMLLQL
jgi:ribosomal protein S18 acetylase RimI-like enzyme